MALARAALARAITRAVAPAVTHAVTHAKLAADCVAPAAGSVPGAPRGRLQHHDAHRASEDGGQKGQMVGGESAVGCALGTALRGGCASTDARKQHELRHAMATRVVADCAQLIKLQDCVWVHAAAHHASVHSSICKPGTQDGGFGRGCRCRL